MLFVIAAGLLSLAVGAAIGVTLVQVSNYSLGGTLSIGVALDQFAIFALGGTVTAILLAVLVVASLRYHRNR
jgi:hypothetical protein